MSRSQKAGTDDLVDAVVYRLYGLTEEKIRIVEWKNFSILIPTSFCRHGHDGKDPKKLLSFLVRRF